MTQTLKLTIAYDGAGFWGSQRQPNARSVQEELEVALGAVSGEAMRIALAGRTDRGVHAVGQVASCPDLRSDWPDERWLLAVNAHLADDLAVTRCQRADRTFHARFDAAWREYRYRIWCGVPQPLLRDRVWQRRSALDVAAMAAGAATLHGPVNLASFAGNGMGVRPADEPLAGRGTVRTIHHCSVRAVEPWWGMAPGAGSGIELRIVADGFLPHAVRALAGALAEIGRGRRSPDWMRELIGLADRRQGPPTAPPHGLVLWRVGYGDETPDPGTDGERTAGEAVAGRANG
jgi:tRNA pseudouridine38-40 synthase